ncbi:MAG: glycosyltransferase [Candidatus Asgardarchaeia archaeon]
MVPLVEERPSENYIFIPTRVVYHKNLHTAIKALYILRKEFSKDVKLILSGVIGDQAYWKYLQKLIRKLELGKYVRHIGFISDEKLWSLYRNAVCHWFISYMEDFGLTAPRVHVPGDPRHSL